MYNLSIRYGLIMRTVVISGMTDFVVIYCTDMA